MHRNKIKNQIFECGGGVDKIYLSIAIALALFGTIMVISAGGAYASAKYGDALYFAKKQVIWLGLGIIAMVLGSRLTNRFYKKATPWLYLFTLALLALTLVIGFVGNGAQRWISIGPLTIQPSEIAKLTMVMMLSLYFDKNESSACEMKSGKRALINGTLIPACIMLVPILLVMLQKHLSCIIILGTIGIILIVIAGVNVKYISGFILLGCAGVSYIALFTDYTKDRITVWLDPEAYKLTGGWQTLQGLMAIGSGGLFGKGLGHGELKHCYVSEPANDMIFAILCEEVGLIGAAIALSLFAALVARGFMIAFKANTTYERLLCLGINIKIAIQTLLNVGVVTNTIPNTGISLPFFSYGGSSLIMLLFEIGIVLSASRRVSLQK